jgi:alpha-amylase
MEAFMSARFKFVFFQVEVIRIMIFMFVAASLLLTSGCSSGDRLPLKAGDIGVEGQNSSASVSDAASLATGVFPDVDRKPRVIENKYGIYYEIFVRSFADSDGDGIGDIKGLTSMLDYLNDGDPQTDTDLGVNGIYLMPVNVSPSYHKYDVTNYYEIDPEYGTLEDFELFLTEAHKRGMRVIMDLVVNHTSSEHPWFKESATSAGGLYRDFYNWADDDTEGYDIKSVLSSGSKIWHSLNGSYYYGYFWSGMPDLNYDNPKVREEIKDVARFWLEKGVDGFRLDAAMHIYGVYEKPVGTRLQEKNIQWWKEFGAAAEQIDPDVYLVGEVWDKTYVIAPYYEGLDSLFNFDVGEGIIKVIRSGSAAAVSSKGFSQWLAAKYETYGKAEPKYLDAPFLTNHDQNRIMDRLSDDTAKARLAAGIYLTLPGNPFIYYGEEIGMRGSKPDEMIRVPFIWYEEPNPPQCTWQSTLNNISTVPCDIQSKDPDSLLNHYKGLIRVRQSSDALMKGAFRPVETGNRAVIAYERYIPDDAGGRESVIVLHNISGEVQKVSLDMEIHDAAIIFDSTSMSKVMGTDIEIQPLSTLIIGEG